MRLVHTVLKDVNEQLPLHAQGEASIPLLGLAEACNSIGGHREGYVELTEASTGADLKATLSGMRLKDQIAALQIFRDGMRAVTRLSSAPIPLFEEFTHSAWPTTAKDRLEQLEAEERIRFRAKARWILLVAFAPIPPLIIGAMIAVSWYKGVGMDSSVVKGIMNTATEILKLIFTI